MSGHRPQVLVVGAGPVGLTAALTLARAGLTVTLLEQRAELIPESRAATFHPATLDLLAHLGVADRLIAEGTVVERLQWRTRRSHLIAEMSMNLLSGLTGHPFRLHAEQETLLTLLAGELAQHPHARLRLATPVDAITDTGRQVQVRAGGRWETADYVIAADGAHSALRTALGLPFMTTGYPTQALRIFTDSPLEAWLPGLAPLTYVRDPEVAGGCSLLQLPGHWRLVLRPPSTDTSPSSQTAAALARHALPIPGHTLRIAHAHTYRLRRGILGSFRHGRVLFAGDAAHVTSTAGGLNMNAGIREAADLAQVLAAVLGDAAPASALDAWATRSLRIIREAVIPRSEARVAGAQDGDQIRQRQAVTRLIAIAADPAATRTYLAEASLLDTVFPSDPTR